MKKVKMLALAFSLLSVSSLNAQENSKKIEQVIIEFSMAGDQNDADKLAKCLDANYRVVMNRLFGSTDVAVMPREVYLEKIRTNEFGGDKRTVKIEEIVVNGSTATAKTKFTGAKMTVVSLLDLVQDSDGNWKLISDTPIIN